MDLPTALMFQKIADLLCNDVKFKKNLVDSLNANIDIPFINEQTEGVILDALVGTVSKVLKNCADEEVHEACHKKIEETKK